MNNMKQQLMNELLDGKINDFEEKLYEVIKIHPDYRYFWSRITIHVQDTSFVCQHMYTDTLNIIKEIFSDHEIKERAFHRFKGDDLNFEIQVFIKN